MDRQLEIRLGRALQSPYYFHKNEQDKEAINPDRLISVAVQSVTESNLPQDVKDLLAACEKFDRLFKLLKKREGSSPSLETVLSMMDLYSSEEIEDSWQPTISNQGRYPYTTWADSIKIVGTCGGDNLFMLGHEQGTGAAIVARSLEPEPESLHAVYLHELLSHCQDTIVLNESAERN